MNSPFQPLVWYHKLKTLFHEKLKINENNSKHLQELWNVQPTERHKYNADSNIDQFSLTKILKDVNGNISNYEGDQRDQEIRSVHEDDRQVLRKYYEK